MRGLGTLVMDDVAVRISFPISARASAVATWSSPTASTAASRDALRAMSSSDCGDG